MFLRKRKIFQDTIHLKPRFNNHLYDITPIVELILKSNKFKNGIIEICVQSSSSAITIREKMTFEAKKIFMKEIENLIFTINTNESTTISTLKASLLGSSKTVSFSGKNLILSDSHKIFFCEFDRPGIIREIIVAISRN